jgi:hypothetical protein
MLEYIPASFKVIRHVRPKLACARCDHIAQAEAPSRPIARALPGRRSWPTCWWASSVITCRSIGKAPSSPAAG